MAHKTSHRFTCDRCNAKATAVAAIPEKWSRLQISTLAEGESFPNDILVDLCEKCSGEIEDAIGIPFLPAIVE